MIVVVSSHQNCWRVWPLPGSWPCQSALGPDRNAGISAAPASLCCWCGRHSVVGNTHKHTNKKKLVACESFEYFSPDWELASTSPIFWIAAWNQQRPEARELQKTVCSSLTRTQIINKHPALHLHAERCCAVRAPNGTARKHRASQFIWSSLLLLEYCVRYEVEYSTVHVNTNWWRKHSGKQMLTLKTITKDLHFTVFVPWLL